MQRQEQEEGAGSGGAEQAGHRGAGQGGQQAQRLRSLGQEEKRWLSVYYSPALFLYY
jgi:hypothetical protein